LNTLMVNLPNPLPNPIYS